MLLALMDEAYTGSTIGDRSGDSGSEDSNSIDVADPVFLDLLKDENDGLVVCPFHCSSIYVSSYFFSVISIQLKKKKILFLL